MVVRTLVFSEVMKVAHSRRLTAKAGPSGYLESRIATKPGRFMATSTQFWPSDELLVLFRHRAPERSIEPALAAIPPP
jgi:hypothetical protein